ncbi:hypothetical protein QWA68_015137 [Fusarium oxysporum]|nr:hypothetical protein QWA68_015137 [Fusarium oxysporum]
MLAELEELIVYKQCDKKKQAIMRRTWETRLKGYQRNIEIWQQMLRLRAIRQPGPGPRNAPAAQVIYAVLKYQWELGQQLPANKKANIPEKTLYCLRKFTNDAAYRLEVAKAHLNAQAGSKVNITGDYGFQNQIDPTLISLQTQQALYDQMVLLAKYYLRQGEWLIALNKDG